MNEPTLQGLPNQDYFSSPVSFPGATGVLEEEVENIWQRNRNKLEEFEKDILTYQPRSKEFRYAVRVVKHFFRKNDTYDARGVLEALHFIDVIRKRHDSVATTSTERYLLRSVRKVLSAIFQHHYKFQSQEYLQKLVGAYNAIITRYTALGEEGPSAPFTIPFTMDPSISIHPALTNSADQGVVFRPLPCRSDSPGRPSTPTSPTPLRSTDPPTSLSIFNQPSTSDYLALPFQVEPQPTTDEGIVEQPPPVPARPPNRVASMLMRARALAAQTEAPAIEPDPGAIPTETEGPTDAVNVEMEAEDLQLGEAMLVEWTTMPESSDSLAQERDPAMEGEPMETLTQEIAHEVPGADAPMVETMDDLVKSLTVEEFTPSLSYPEQPAAETNNTEDTSGAPPYPVSEDMDDELVEAVRPLGPYLQRKFNATGPDSQTIDMSFVARYGPDLVRVAVEALNQIRAKHPSEGVQSSFGAHPAPEEDTVPEQVDVELPNTNFAAPGFEETEHSDGLHLSTVAEEPIRSRSSSLFDLESESALPEPEPEPEQEPSAPTEPEPEPEVSLPMEPEAELEISLPTEPEAEPEISLPMEPEPELEISTPVEPEPIPRVYSEQSTQTIEVAVQAIPERQQTRLYEVRETGIASFAVHNDCSRISFSFGISSEFYAELRNDSTAKIVVTSSQEPGQGGDDPIDDSWIFMRINWTGSSDAEFLLSPNRSGVASTEIIPLSIVEGVNRLELRRAWCLGGLRGLKLDIKVVRAVRQQRKRGREAFDGQSPEEDDSEALGYFGDSSKRARI
ncbi:hypothetical protein FRC04_003986 [Tulasnella sp. 424]|nr:hypothetical protein FRC04_003986 [Tulasnella sp. 424]KAG8965415.1 hypothetical protein FRC05_003251 [Tulasnella sp. 425]